MCNGAINHTLQYIDHASRLFLKLEIQKSIMILGIPNILVDLYFILD